MGKLHSQLAAVDLLQQRNDLFQLHARVTGACKAPGEKLTSKVSLIQAEKIELQYGRHMALPQSEGIEIGNLVTAKTVDLYQPRHGRLLLTGVPVEMAGDASAPPADHRAAALRVRE
jgi:hypothetical protein